MVNTKKSQDKGNVKGQISSTKNRFDVGSKKTKQEQDDWEIVQKAGKLAGLGGESSDGDSY